MNGLLSFGVVWGGYTLIWYGLTLLRGPGLGIGDLVRPSQIAKCQAWWNTPVGSGSGSGTDPNLGLHADPLINNVPAIPLVGPGSKTPAPNGQVGVNPNTGQPIFSA